MVTTAGGEIETPMDIVCRICPGLSFSLAISDTLCLPWMQLPSITGDAVEGHQKRVVGSVACGI